MSKPKIITFNLYKKSGSTAKILTSDLQLSSSNYFQNEYQMYDTTNKENTNLENQDKLNLQLLKNQPNSTKHLT